MMHPSVHDYPHDEETGERGHEAFFGEFPRAAIFFFVDFLEIGEVYVEEARVKGYESAQNRKTKSEG